MDALRGEKIRVTLVDIHYITAGKVYEQLLEKRALFLYPDVGGLKLHLVMVLEDHEPHEAEHSKDSDCNAHRDQQNTNEFKERPENCKTLF